MYFAAQISLSSGIFWFFWKKIFRQRWQIFPDGIMTFSQYGQTNESMISILSKQAEQSQISGVWQERQETGKRVSSANLCPARKVSKNFIIIVDNFLFLMVMAGKV